ncbi:MTA/SAH nucleosidase [Bombiscardovia nodaiensis]|uniref:MTA/SAH nucleosidase n=1 Tax=Bombiscardovia nodaiensis TaxID=2932181 RepID=A0ABM8B6L4_9BIFI|nr:MTA/SAH nucleosidase [Bombiscardovia nodaiensis]
MNLSQQSIAIQCALPREAAGFQSALQGREDSEIWGYHLSRGRYCNLDLLVCVGGMGAASSAACAQFLVDHYQPQALIFSGIAGSINPGLHIGDVMVSREQHYAETNTAIIAECPPYQEYFASDPSLVSRATNAAQELGYARIPAVSELLSQGLWDGQVQAPRPGQGRREPGQKANFLVGNLSTSDRFNTSEAALSGLVQAFSADGEAMEEAPAAQICGKCGVPFLCVRGVSNPCGQSYEDLNEQEGDMDLAAQAAAQVTLKLLEGLSPQA